MSPVPAQKLREAVFQILYSLHIVGDDGEEIKELISKELTLSADSANAAYERAQAILRHVQELDTRIGSATAAFSIERISVAEKNILRLGTYELFYDNEIPPKVAIAEAVRLTRKFSSPEAAAFVNAVLDTLYKRSLGEAVDEQALSLATEELQIIQEVANEASQDQALEERLHEED
jgi:N utilization substance protein B